MPDEVDETVDLFLIDTRQLVEEARKIRKAEELAKQAKQAKRSLAEGKSPIAPGVETEEPTLPRGFEQPIADEKLIAGLGPLVERKVEEILDQKSRTKPLTSSASPLPSPQNDQALPKGFFGGSEQTRLGAIAGAKTTNAFNEAIKKQKQLENQIKLIKKDQESFLNSFKNINKMALGAPAALSSLSGTAGLVSRLGVFGGPAGIIIATVVTTVLGAVSEILKQFQRGGALSTSLKEPQQARTLNSVEDDNAYRSGTKYITDDLRLVQKAPNSSNTANIKYEHIRYTVENAGR